MAELARIADADLMASFGSRLREARKERRISQQGVAEVAGVSRQTVAAWELTRAAPESLSQSKYVALAALLGVRYEWLRFESGPMKEGDPIVPKGTEAATSDSSLMAQFREKRRMVRLLLRWMDDIIGD